VRALVGGALVALGEPSVLEHRGVGRDPARQGLADLAAAGQTAVLVAREPATAAAASNAPGIPGTPASTGDAQRDGDHGARADPPARAPELLGVIAVADDVRPAAAAAVEALRRTGVQRVVLLTGDHLATARAVAHQVGIPEDDVYADLLPEQKEAVVRELMDRHKRVAMVGDGVNDAPALAAATVGIAMGASGSDVALETADVALVADDLSRLPWVFDLSRRAAWTIRVNVALALGIKAVVLALAALGIANLWLAIAADTGASVLVTFNGMRLLGRVSLPKVEDVAALRRRYGLEEEDEHAGHVH
jgi:cation transport ATPase